MKRTTLHGMCAVLLATWQVFAYSTPSLNSQSAAEASTIGTVRLTQAVLVDGKPLAAATYQVRLTSDQPTVAVGESLGAERWSSSSKTARSQGVRSQP
jgi:hypothetical protein